MKAAIKAMAAAALVAAAVGLGYWLGAQQRQHAAAPAGPANGDRVILYYRNPMGLPDTSPTPKKDSMGMDYIPVYADLAQPAGERRVLYYRNPMGLPDTSPVPKKDSMGMDYIPVHDGDDMAGADVRISSERIQKLGVRTAVAERSALTRPVRAVGTLQVDERRLVSVAPRFEGWIDKLHVNATAQTVSRGQPLMEVYSPELLAAQRDYAIAAQALRSMPEASAEAREGMRRLADAALERLRNWEISEQDLARLSSEGATVSTLTLRAPAGGVVVDKPAVQGMRFMAGETMFRIADLSSLWLIAEVFEQDLALVRLGQRAVITVNAYPERRFEGRVTFVYPTVNPQTRTARARVELVNPGGLLKPEMYASVELEATARGPVLSVPASAVLRSGTRDVVLVEVAEGRFQPREVKLGLQSDDRIEVREGLGEGENVVVSTNFLIDAESNLRAALAGFGAPAAADGDPGAPARKSADPHTGHSGH